PPLGIMKGGIPAISEGGRSDPQGHDSMPPHHRSDPGAGRGSARYPGTFRVAFQEALDGLGWQVRRWRSDAVECLDKDGHEHLVGLENLYRRARHVERSQWPGLAAEVL